MRRIISALVIFVFICGCAPKTIDSSTDEKLNSSMEKVSNSLSSEKQEEFKTALREITLSEAFSGDDSSKSWRSRLNGKTAEQVITEGNQLIAERKKKEREQALKEIEELKTEIAELEKKRSGAAEAKEALKKFEVTRSRFFFREDWLKEPAIELTMKNKTPVAVSRVYFEAVLASPKRSVPWVTDSFNYHVSGGIEPNEELTENLSPNRFSGWGSAPSDRKDLILTLTVTRIDGADEKSIYDSEFSDRDDNRQKELIERVAELEKAL